MRDMVGHKCLEEYFQGIYKNSRLLDFRQLGSGVHGTGYSITLETDKGKKTYVLKGVKDEGLGHDYPSDRAAMMLLSLDTFGSLPKHIQAFDVLSFCDDGVLRPIGGGSEYYLLMEEARGTSYFHDLEGLSKKDSLDEIDKKKIELMVDYLGLIHSKRKTSIQLYYRKLRDIIGHGECLMGVFDTYPEGFMTYKEMAEIEKKCIDWRARLKNKHQRLSEIHGDFHPGNILFSGGNIDSLDFVLLDRSRGPWGEPADDLTALTINYIFFSIKHFSRIKGAYLEGFNLFMKKYIEQTGDEEILDVLAPFLAFRGAVVANPIFYPELTNEQRSLIFIFVNNVLDSERFDFKDIESYF